MRSHGVHRGLSELGLLVRIGVILMEIFNDLCVHTILGGCFTDTQWSDDLWV